MNALLQVLSLGGAGLILFAYLALQQRWWSSDGWAYLWFNLVGAAMLTVVALVDRRLGFIVLEAAWVVISLVALLRRGRSRPVSA